MGNEIIKKWKYRKEFLDEKTNKLREEIDEYKKDLEIIKEAERYLIEISKEIQDKICISIEKFVNLFLKPCFPDYTFQMNYVSKRGKTETDLYLIDKEGNKFYPQDSMGGGVVDIISFGLRVALWLLTKNKTSVFILDEPFKYLSRDLLPKLSTILQDISNKLGIQMIMVTHEKMMLDIIEPDIDKVFIIDKNKFSYISNI